MPFPSKPTRKCPPTHSTSPIMTGRVPAVCQLHPTTGVTNGHLLSLRVRTLETEPLVPALFSPDLYSQVSMAGQRMLISSVLMRTRHPASVQPYSLVPSPEQVTSPVNSWRPEAQHHGHTQHAQTMCSKGLWSLLRSVYCTTVQTDEPMNCEGMSDSWR